MNETKITITELPGDHGIDDLIRSKMKPGETVVGIPDHEGASPGLDALVRASNWKRAGFRVLMQLNCRDRNRIDLAGRYLGALALGLDYIVIVTGLHTSLGTVPEAKPVYDLDPIQTMSYLRTIEPFDKKARSGPMTGIRTHVQNRDEFELNRLKRLLETRPDFLLIHSNHHIQNLAAWINHCSQVPGLDQTSLFFEMQSEAIADNNTIDLPELITGLYLKY